MRPAATALVIAALGLSACRASRAARAASSGDSARADSIAHARQDSTNRAQPGYVVDSAVAPSEELARFREAIGGLPTTTLANASGSRADLARRLVEAVARR